MTPFTKENLIMDGEYVMYKAVGQAPRFVARFKYVRGEKAHFVAFLKKNFTVEEYFAQVDAKVSPLKDRKSVV